jgi:hypothetical protein
MSNLAKCNAVAAVFGLVLSLCASQESRETAETVSPASRPSLTVFPIVMAGAPSIDAANAVGTLIERGGLEDVRVHADAFRPDGAADLATQATAFGAFVATKALSTDHALFAAFIGSPKEGVKEIRGVIVDRKGTVSWRESLKTGDRAFDEARPNHPMDCAVLLVARLRAPLGIKDPLRATAKPGKLAAKIEGEIGMPSKDERAAMASRVAKLKAAGGKAALKVYPPRIGGDWSVEAARSLAKLITDRGLMVATAAETAVRFETLPGPNEQRTLWSGARSIREAVAQLPPSPDYRLFLDCIVAPGAASGAVHTYLVSPEGELVVVDFQNDHHDDFAKVAPRSVEGCCELAAIRLAGYLR